MSPLSRGSAWRGSRPWRGKMARVVLTRHGRRVAALVPYEQSLPDLWGALQGSVTVPTGTDLTAGIDEAWLADA
jgi:antitoxin (DNA-binding transcriptional repressor) of toxin-antitoxin stability system